MVEILRAEAAEGRMSLLVGRTYAIYALTLDAATGAVLAERALY